MPFAIQTYYMLLAWRTLKSLHWLLTIGTVVLLPVIRVSTIITYLSFKRLCNRLFSNSRLSTFSPCCWWWWWLSYKYFLIYLLGLIKLNEVLINLIICIHHWIFRFWALLLWIRLQVLINHVVDGWVPLYCAHICSTGGAGLLFLHPITKAWSTEVM